jgi:uncharacterized membrane protein YesL
MKWLKERFEREGPGIPKDAPKKQGLALFAQIVLREAWELFKLNLLIVVFSLPLVTAPAAAAAALRICVSMSRDENIYLVRDFREAFRDNFWSASFWGAGFSVALVLSGYAVFIYGQLALSSLTYAIPLALSLAVTVLLLLLAVHLFVLMVCKPLPPLRLLRLSFVAMLARPAYALAALVFVAALWLTHIAFYPVSVFMPAVFNFSLGTLAVTFAVLKATDFVLLLANKEEERSSGMFADAQLRR